MASNSSCCAFLLLWVTYSPWCRPFSFVGSKPCVPETPWEDNRFNKRRRQTITLFAFAIKFSDMPQKAKQRSLVSLRNLSFVLKLVHLRNRKNHQFTYSHFESQQLPPLSQQQQISGVPNCNISVSVARKSLIQVQRQAKIRKMCASYSTNALCHFNCSNE